MTEREEAALIEKLTKSGESPEQLVIHNLEPLVNGLGISWKSAEELIRMAEVIGVACYKMGSMDTLMVIKGEDED
jgi:hypothetical protein